MGKTYWGLAVAMLVTAVGAGVFFGLWRLQPPEVASSTDKGVVALAPAEVGSDAPEQEEQILVHVSGRVLHPGVVEVDASARVGDVIVAAGGALFDARLGEINLAAPVMDGAQVVVPGPRTRLGMGDGWIGSAADSSDLVSLNQATPNQLEEIPGVGPVLAGKIVDYREANGPFRRVEDLLGVSGIGEKKLAGLREYVVIP